MINQGMSSLTKKYIMGLSGLFLILFLIVHCGINSIMFIDLNFINPADNGQTFLHIAHFMGTNILMRILEVGLIVGFVVHIYDGLMLWYQNAKARPVGYAMTKGSQNSKWYSRSMGILGTLILMFLIVHLGDFWIPNRSNQFATGHEINLFEKMLGEFQNIWIVILYVLACISLAWHLLHGFKSAFQSLGLNHSKYNSFIENLGFGFSILIPFLFALMPISMYLGWIKL